MAIDKCIQSSRVARQDWCTSESQYLSQKCLHECAAVTEVHLIIHTVPDGHNGGKTYVHVLPHQTVFAFTLHLLPANAANRATAPV